MPVSTDTKPYRIGRSKTGLGLFATQPIKKGVKIIQYFGPLLDSKNEKHDAIENKYLFQISKRWTRSARMSRATSIIPASRMPSPTSTRRRRRSSSAQSRRSSRARRSTTITVRNISKNI
jgi:hypothetical protein